MGRADADTPTLAALGLLLGALSRRTLTLQTLAGASPSPSTAPRAVLSVTHLLLPAAVMQDATLSRAAIAHAAAHLLYSPPASAPCVPRASPASPRCRSSGRVPTT